MYKYEVFKIHSLSSRSYGILAKEKIGRSWCGATSFLRNSDKIYEKKEMLLRRKSKLKHPQLSIWIAGDFFAQIHL